MTPDELQALADAATEGPWSVVTVGGTVLIDTRVGAIAEMSDWPPEQALATAAFIAACRTEVPALLSKMRERRGHKHAIEGE